MTDKAFERVPLMGIKGLLDHSCNVVHWLSIPRKMNKYLALFSIVVASAYAQGGGPWDGNVYEDCGTTKGCWGVELGSTDDCILSQVGIVLYYNVSTNYDKLHTC